MFIGEVSKKTGASPKAIRLYESLGLLVQIKREGTYRVYDQGDVEFIKLIREAQTLGVSLSDLKKLLVGRNELDWSTVIVFLAEKQKKIDIEIASLEIKKEKIATYNQQIKECLDSD
ncbi:MerR family transcriptional regulator [Vibrio sp. 404]|uniref:MerR family transcriptional regulator n=1 Tax=Vibrio marinisediminis TaxID=2758441 RepID=A0A7W2FTJ4_9VIBR|nr:MerR family transcriptional regulator [Vibrio marinisediminis]MBA5763996.1 MerR family transcriptional regulator [Vibrio marinisediminis]